MAREIDHQKKEPTPQELESWLDALIDDNALIVVEGKRDKLALVELGIDKQRIVTINKPLFAIVEFVAENCKRVILLTDLDKEGRKLYHVLKRDLVNHGVKVDMFFRAFLIKNTSLCCIEGLKQYIRRRTQSDSS
ncbi:toprim domain-containing protein [Candidatus Woesearchaeota archaeon]|nr:toprim domain-containing protein [Candidatus Woesearchaeota archaeon]